MNLMTVYPDQPYGHASIMHPLLDDVSLIEPVNTAAPEDLHQKDLKLLELLEKKIQAGENVLIYTSWVRIDTQAKLKKLLEDKGYKTAVLTASKAPEDREEWVSAQVANGVRILITNPSLVETGLDLNDFTTLIYYNIMYNLFTLRQSSRRSWRINQTALRIEVYFFYYMNTIQERALSLMASKLAAAGLIEGQVTDEGLAAMSDCRDLTSQLARELTKGIRSEVEDLADVFKRMAVLKTEDEKRAFTERKAAKTRVITAFPGEKQPVSQAPTLEQPTLFQYESPATDLEKFVFTVPRTGKKLKTAVQNEGQLSFLGWQTDSSQSA